MFTLSRVILQNLPGIELRTVLDALGFIKRISFTFINSFSLHYRSLLARNPKGHLVAGIYFPVKPKDQVFTMFFDSHNGKQRKKLKFETFLKLQTVCIH